MSNHKTILDEHAKLDVLVRDLRAVSRWEPQLLEERKVRLQLASDLESLQVRLRQHFDTEESGAYLDEITSRRPSAGPILKVLHDEHGWMLKRLAALEIACLGASEGPGTPASIQEKLAAVLDVLHRHERRETALIQDVFRM